MKLFVTKKGFTLIEMIVTIAILFMTLAIVSPLLNYNLKSLYTTQNKNDLQREAYGALENLTKKAMEAKEIYMMKDIEDNFVVNKTVVNSSQEPPYHQYNVVGAKSIKYINFITGEGKSYIFIYNATDKTLKYGESDSNVNTEIAHDVDDIKLSPLPEGESFDKCSGIKIQVSFKKNLVKDSYIVTSEVKFRNWALNP